MQHNEDTRVKLPLLMHMHRLGYSYLSKKDYIIDKETNIFKEIFKSSLERINKREFSDYELNSVISEINNLIEDGTNGRTFYNRLTDSSNQIKLIDFIDVNNNSFNVVSELTFEDNNDYFRPDVNILINGIPLAFIEVKKPNNDGGIKAEFDRTSNRAINKNYSKYMNLIQIICMSNNMEYNNENNVEVTQGSFYTTPNGKNTYYNFFREEREKDLVFENDEIPFNIKRDIAIDNNYTSILNSPELESNLNHLTPVNKFTTSLFTKERFLMILRYGIVYVNSGTSLNQRHIVRYPQLFAMLNIKDMLDEGIKKGVLWHTQGSGKTALAYFSSRYIRDYFADRNINTKFYFIVDRLDLKTQAESEFSSRNLYVNSIDSKENFKKDFETIKTTSGNASSYTGQMTVVNIQKFDDNSKVKNNDYGLNLQRVYYMDEVHRSYKEGGSFLKNLLSSDKNAIYIGLTGTPIVINGKKTTDIFGGYIHKYFYDKSILDGYTLKIKRENIETEIRQQLTRHLEDAMVKENTGDEALFYESNLYCNSLSKYIEDNFKEFRYHNNDNSLGGMIVSYSSKQARSIKRWFDKNSDLKVALVLHDEGTKDERKIIQDAFKKGEYDLLIVYQMLLTGFDAPRLKKMYLNRKITEHGLLQTLTRVNRTYTNPYTGDKYKYGYVVDFVGIKEAYEDTTRRYVAELKEDLGGYYDEKTISEMFVDIDEIWEEYINLCKKYRVLINTINNNLEDFKKNFIDDKNLSELRSLANSLIKIKEYHKELIFSKKEGFSKNSIDMDRLSKSIKLLKERISFLNQQERLKSKDNILLVLEKIEKECFIEFIKTNIEDLNLGNYDDRLDAIRTLLNDIELIVNQCADKNDKDLISVGEEVRRILQEIQKAKEIKDINKIQNDLLKAKKRIETIRDKDKYLFDLYNGDIVSIRVHKKYIKKFYPTEKLSNNIELDRNISFIFAIYKSKNKLDDILRHNSNYNIDALEQHFKSSSKDFFKKTLGREEKKFIRNEILIESNLKF